MSRHYRVDGDEIKRLIQDAVRDGKNTVIVYDYDEAGNLLRVGCVLVEPGASVAPDSEIHWFDQGSIHLVDEDAPIKGVKAELDVRFKQAEKAHAYTLIQEDLPGGGQMRLRSLIRQHASGNPGFAIQVEARSSPNSSWNPAVRYDCAHGSFHRDMISSDGEKRKVPLDDLEGEAAICEAFEEMASNVGSWVHELGHSASPNPQRSDLVLKRFHEAEAALLELWRSPGDLADKESRFVQFR